MATIPYRFRVRRRTAANWASLNEVLLDSEIGLESDTTWPGGGRKFKIGDGSTAWNDLDYAVPDAAGGSGGIDPVTESRFFDDFMGKPPTITTVEAGTNSDWTVDLLGTGGSLTQRAASTLGRGIWRLNCGTNATGATAMSRGDGVNNVLLGQGAYEDEWRISVPALSTALQRFIAIVGLGDAWGAATTDELTIRYIDNVNGGAFHLVSKVAGVSTTYNGSTVVVAGAMYRVKLGINAGGTEAYLYVNDILEATCTTVPTATMRAGAWVNSFIGTTAKSLDVDYYHNVETFSSPR